MRVQVVGVHKMRGYWDWLVVQQDRAEEPLPPNPSRSESELHELACRLVAATGRKCSVLDAVRLRSWMIAAEDLEADRELSPRIVHDGAELLLVREEDGTPTLGLLLDGHPRDWSLGGTRCRAFLLEPPVLKRLEAGLRLQGEVSLDCLLLQVLQRRTVQTIYQTTALLCGVPELEGECRPDSTGVTFQRFPMPGHPDRFPPRAGPLLVAVVFYHGEEGPPANTGP